MHPILCIVLVILIFIILSMRFAYSSWMDWALAVFGPLIGGALVLTLIMFFVGKTAGPGPGGAYGIGYTALLLFLIFAAGLCVYYVSVSIKGIREYQKNKESAVPGVKSPQVVLPGVIVLALIVLVYFLNPVFFPEGALTVTSVSPDSAREVVFKITPATGGEKYSWYYRKPNAFWQKNEITCHPVPAGNCFSPLTSGLSGYSPDIEWREDSGSFSAWREGRPCCMYDFAHPEKTQFNYDEPYYQLFDAGSMPKDKFALALRLQYLTQYQRGFMDLVVNNNDVEVIKYLLEHRPANERDYWKGSVFQPIATRYPAMSAEMKEFLSEK